MTNPISTVLLWSSIITILTIFEIETDGRYDWTEKDPSWSRTFPIIHRLHVTVRGIMSTVAHLLQILVFHLQFLLGVQWTPTTELLALSTYFIVLPLYDVTWFILRPRTKRYQEIDTWKRSKNLGIRGIPLNLLLSVPIATALTWIASQLTRNDQIMTDFGVTLLGFVTFLTFASVVAPMYRSWHNHVAQTPATDLFSDPPQPLRSPAPRTTPQRKPSSGFMGKLVIVAGASCATNGLLLAGSEQHPGLQPWLAGNPSTYLLSGLCIILTVIAYDRNWKKQPV